MLLSATIVRVNKHEVKLDLKTFLRLVRYLSRVIGILFVFVVNTIKLHARKSSLRP